MKLHLTFWTWIYYNALVVVKWNKDIFAKKKYISGGVQLKNSPGFETLRHITLMTKPAAVYTCHPGFY